MAIPTPIVTRYEFYACADLPANVEVLNPLIDDWQDTYNFVRPPGESGEHYFLAMIPAR